MLLRKEHAPLALVAVVGVLAALLVTVGGVDCSLLEFFPALVLLLPLLAGRYVGEERIAALAAAFVPRRGRAAARLAPRLPRAPRAILTGGRLAAVSHALRGPPVLAPAR